MQPVQRIHGAILIQQEFCVIQFGIFNPPIFRKRSLKCLFRAGVPIAVASHGGDLYREMDALAAAGIPALDVLVAATRNGAIALHQLDQRGTIQAGKSADLIVLPKNPGEDTRNLRGGRVMQSGEWVR